ncbi:alkaline phosphatase, partial [Pseudarthrobacter sp. NKDBFgelt]
MTSTSPAGVSRRTIVKGSVLTAALAAVPAAAQAGTVPAAPHNAGGVALVRNRLTLPSGFATGDVTSDSAVLWSRASGSGRMTAILRAVDDGGEVLRGRRQ